MKVLITGAAGNLGSFLTRHMLDGPYQLNLLVHNRDLPAEIINAKNTSVLRGNLSDPETLRAACQNVDCIVHFAGKLFAPNPEDFLPITNVDYVKNLVTSALAAGVKKFILISFPHVEGETNPEKPAQGLLRGTPKSVHARTRLEAEKHLFQACEGTSMTGVSLRVGMIYGRGVLMIEAARRLMHLRLLGVWRKPTWIHLLALPDFLNCVEAAVIGPKVQGIYNLGDDHPMTLQSFLDRIALHWGYKKPWRAPPWVFHVAAWFVEIYAAIFGTTAPLTRDFIRIGMASYVMNTKRMRAEIISRLFYPSLSEGLELL
jgi:nucleoside-diphosphate-sugar epimerase